MKMHSQPTVTRALSLALMSGFSLLTSAGTALANDADVLTIPVTITLTDVMQSQVPLYISVQTEADYRSMKGQGTILKETTAGTLSKTVSVPTAGDYAITLWHDLDNDGRFSMNERYEISDGWGSSGDVSVPGGPTFQTAKITVPNFGAKATVKMIYPKP